MKMAKRHRRTKAEMVAYRAAKAEKIAKKFHAYIFRNSTMPVMTGNPRTPPDGHLDSTIGLGFLDSPSYMAQYCQALVVGDYLCEHPTEAGMVRISDRMIPVCEKIINDL